MTRLPDTPGPAGRRHSETTARRLRLCFIADVNSVHSRRFIRYFPERGHEVLVLSTTGFAGDSFAGARVVNLGGPVSRLRRAPLRGWRSTRDAMRSLGIRINREGPGAFLWECTRRLRESGPRSESRELPDASIRTALEHALEDRLGVYEAQREQARKLVRAFRPDILQCLRLPVEGFIGAYADYRPTAHFCWGNDLTLYAREYAAYGELTRAALAGCAAFLTDCRRDERLALDWGLRAPVPTLVVPGAGGIDTRVDGGVPAAGGDAPPDVAAGAEVSFLTLRGLGGRYVDNVPVIQAIPHLRRLIGDRFKLRMAGAPNAAYDLLLHRAAQAVDGLGFIELLERVPHERVPELIARHRLIFSATYHDGTPNSMLETMWYGGIPICSDLESIREWIVDGENGYLFDMRSPENIAAVFARAVNERARHDEFRRRNRALIIERADYETCMARVMELYEGLA